MVDLDKLAHRLMALGLPWQAVDVKYALTSAGIEAARFANADTRNAVVDVLNAVLGLIERVATLEADAEVSVVEHEKTRRYGEAFLDSLRAIRLICTDALGDEFAQVDGGCHDEMVAMVANRLNEVRAERDALRADAAALHAFRKEQE